MKKTSLIISTLFMSSFLFSCGDVNNNNVSLENRYTVIWQNDDGTILEIDRNVLEGSIPEYNGETPVKEKNGNINYMFNGWDLEIKEIYLNTQFTATYKEVKDEFILEDTPILDENKKEVSYGYYPQSYVFDKTLINELESIKGKNEFNYVLYKNNYYLKEKANVYNNETYTFNNGEVIKSNEEYWFKLEKINWKILKVEDNKYHLLSKDLLDATIFNTSLDNNESIKANNYEFSELRNYLNNEFLKKAFHFNAKHLNVIDFNKDYISLLTEEDYLNSSYGFSNVNESSSTRLASTSEYCRIKNTFINKENNLYSSSYFTKSPSLKFDYAVKTINSGGYISEYVVNENHAIRPYIVINL